MENHPPAQCPASSKAFGPLAAASLCLLPGASAQAQCPVVPPLGVDVTSEAYQEVIDNDPICCFDLWDGICQAAYDLLSGTAGAPPNNLCFNAQFVSDGTAVQNTEGAISSATASCTPGDGADVWYIYVATCNGTVTVNTCGSGYNTSLSVWSVCGGVQIACNDDWCGSGSFVSFPGSVGTSYHIRVGGIEGATGDLVLNTACNTVTCPVEPPAEVDVAHPAYLQVILAQPACCSDAWTASCQSAYDDIFSAPPANDLCAAASGVSDGQYPFNNMNAGTEGTGTCTGDDDADVWFRYQATCTGYARVATCGSAFNTTLSVFSACGGQEVACDVGDCGAGSRVFFPVQAGSAYRIRVAGVQGAMGNGTIQLDCASPDACPVAPPQGVDVSSAAYIQTILELPECCGAEWSEACQDAYDGFGNVTPPNDLCNGALPQTLPPGSTLVFAGDNSGATDDGGEAQVFVWESFTLTNCSDVTIAHCLAGFVYEEFSEVLVTDCADPATAFVLGEANECSVTHPGLGPGTYYIPVLVRSGVTPIGAYAFEVSAVPCSDYCMAQGIDGDGPKIASVDLLEIANTSTGNEAYEDFTSVSTLLPRDVEHAISIALTDGGPSTQVSVWVDLDHDLAFGPTERLYISEPGPGPHEGVLIIPVDATLGATRMRIRLHDADAGPNPGPCGIAASGQVEDYTVLIDLASVIAGSENLPFTLYPNPSDGVITLRLGSLDGPLLIEVVDMAGRVVESKRDVASRAVEFVLGTPDRLAPGIYVLRLTAGERPEAQRFVVR